MLLLPAALLASACATDAKQAPAAHATAARPGIEGVMHEKLDRAQALVAGIARADFPSIEANAMQLYVISEDAEFLVHDTVTYRVFSGQFRDIARRMADDARAEDLDAVTTGYQQLIDTCVGCHEYLRQERLIRDFPGKVSQADVLESLDPARGGRRAPG